MPDLIPAQKVTWWYRKDHDAMPMLGSGIETHQDFGQDAAGNSGPLQQWLLCGSIAVPFESLAGWQRAPSLAGPWETVRPVPPPDPSKPTD